MSQFDDLLENISGGQGGGGIGDLVGGLAGGDTGPADQQRDLGRRLVGEQFAELDPMVAV